MTFTARVTKDERVLVSWQGQVVTSVAGAHGRRLADALGRAHDDAAYQFLLARATGNFKHGNER